MLLLKFHNDRQGGGGAQSGRTPLPLVREPFLGEWYPKTSGCWLGHGVSTKKRASGKGNSMSSVRDGADTLAELGGTVVGRPARSALAWRLS